MKAFFCVCFALSGIFFLNSCTNNNDTSTNTNDNSSPLPQGIAAPQPITYTVDSIYPHDPHAFTQGLEYLNGKLYEGTGLNEQTNVRVVNIKSGKPEFNHHLSDTSIFGEGITIFKNKLYQLTWTSHKVFVYDLKNLNQTIQTLNWSSEGWGLTHDSSSLIVSDGITSNIYFVSPDDFKTLRTISVQDNNGPVLNLNELELINGYLYANQWQTDSILKIDPANGHVVGILNFKGILDQYAAKERTQETDVLNGIAYNPSTKELYITGKKWPKLFAIHLNNW